jgi:hypothetical protein
VQVNLARVYLELGRIDDCLAAATGRHAEACTHWRAALTAYRELGDPQADEVANKLA